MEDKLQKMQEDASTTTRITDYVTDKPVCVTTVISRTPGDHLPIFTISILEEKVEVVEGNKYLGVHLNIRFNWKKHRGSLQEGQSRPLRIPRLFNVCSTMSVIADILFCCQRQWHQQTEQPDQEGWLCAGVLSGHFGIGCGEDDAAQTAGYQREQPASSARPASRPAKPAPSAPLQQRTLHNSCDISSHITLYSNSPLCREKDLLWQYIFILQQKDCSPGQYTFSLIHHISWTFWIGWHSTS